MLSICSVITGTRRPHLLLSFLSNVIPEVLTRLRDQKKKKKELYKYLKGESKTISVQITALLAA